MPMTRAGEVAFLREALREVVERFDAIVTPNAYFTVDCPEAQALNKIQAAMNEARQVLGTNTHIVGSEVAKTPPPQMDDWQASDLAGRPLDGRLPVDGS